MLGPVSPGALLDRPMATIDRRLAGEESRGDLLPDQLRVRPKGSVSSGGPEEESGSDD